MSGALAAEPRRRAGDAPIPPRVLMVATGDPSHDPRIRWAAEVAAGLASTHVLGTVWFPEEEYRTYEGDVYVERFSVALNASRRALERNSTLAHLKKRPGVHDYLEREGKKPPEPATAKLRRFRRIAADLHHEGAAALRLAAEAAYYGAIVSAIRRRVTAESMFADVIVALDLYALAAVAPLARAQGSSLVYDSHELWPHADLLAASWQPALIERLERRLLRDARTVITVSPQLARLLEEMYGLERVLTVPNAAPLEPDVSPSSDRAPSDPVKFLLQGGIAPGRGIDVLLEGWRAVDPSRATLYLRCPETSYFAELRARYADLFESGRVLQLEPVRPEELIAAATFADVGVIPYVGPNPNHVYCCPNKLSQYMQAGLAILSNDLPFVRSVVDRHGCGTAYRAEQPETIAMAVGELAREPGRLASLKRRARTAALEEFNWDAVSGPYRDALAGALAAAQKGRR